MWPLLAVIEIILNIFCLSSSKQKIVNFHCISPADRPCSCGTFVTGIASLLVGLLGLTNYILKLFIKFIYPSLSA